MIAVAALVGAIVCEVTGTVSLRMASDGKRTWWAGVVLGYVLAFSLLSVALGAGMPLGVAYGIWIAAGVAITAVLSRLLFDEPLTWVMGAGIVLIGGGVLLIELGSGAGVG